MRFFPIFLDLEQQKVLVVGGGEQAAQKLRLVAKTGAVLRVVAAEVCPEIAAMAASGAVALERRSLLASDLVGVRLA
jgi:uroporphyrin-III C-methyltransferase/precorrin-2 dehydrogenase/sirohydrochlorin ferrochelatase